MLDWDLKKSTLYFQMKQPTVKKITWLPKRQISIKLLKLFRSKLYVLLKLKKKYILWKWPSFSWAFQCRLTSVLSGVLVLQKQTGLNLTEKESRRYVVKKTLCLIASESMASLEHTEVVSQNNPDYIVQGGVSQDQGRYQLWQNKQSKIAIVTKKPGGSRPTTGRPAGLSCCPHWPSDLRSQRPRVSWGWPGSSRGEGTPARTAAWLNSCSSNRLAFCPHQSRSPGCGGWRNWFHNQGLVTNSNLFCSFLQSIVTL